MEIFAYLEKGTMLDKTEMEDRVTIGKNVLSSGFHHFHNLSNGFVAIMDGVGGVAGSAYASSYVADSLSRAPLLPDQQSIRQLISDIHHELCSANKTATTLTGLYITESVSTLIHIGNTRLSVLKNGYLVPFTEDQTEGNLLLEEGIAIDRISEESFRSLNSCIGFDEKMLGLLQIETFSLGSGNKILLTSDGIHDFLKEEELELALKNPPSEDCLKKIAEMSRTHGSEDDISIIIMEI